jgi:hypothetical protein
MKIANLNSIKDHTFAKISTVYQSVFGWKWDEMRYQSIENLLHVLSNKHGALFMPFISMIDLSLSQ